MPVAEQSKFFTNFTGGLNTEFTPLNFPDNAAQEIDNVDLFRTGEAKRRLGLDFESGYTVRPETTSASILQTAATSIHEWKAVNGKGDINFTVVQIGEQLYFHDLGAEPMSGNLRGSVLLTPYKTQSDAGNFLIDTAYGEGVMVITNPGINPVVITYDEDADTFTASAIELKIRDFEGVEDNLEITERPADLTPNHEYNLRNQGWPTDFPLSGDPDSGDPVAYTKLRKDVYPSNADIVYFGKQSAADNAENIGAYSPDDLFKSILGTTQAPRGSYILDLFNQDRQSVSGIAGLLDDVNLSTSQRPTTVEFYAGRIFYAGVKDRNYTGDIYFSKLIDNVDDLGICYQQQDPTAEDLNSLLPTDGGVIHINDLGEVRAMVEIGQDLIVAAQNGVWAISGVQSGNFSADNFSVRKLTDDGAVGRDSVVLAEGVVLWWSPGGIWAMQSGQIDDVFQVDRISRDTIQTFYDAIPEGARAYARGFYDEFNKRIFWFYNDTDTYNSIDFRFRYNRALVLDITLNAFYTYTMEDLNANSPWIAGAAEKEPGTESIVNYNVVLGNDNVVLGVDNITQDVAFEQFAEVKIKLLTFVQNEDTTYSYTFSEFSNKSFTDWQTWDRIANNISNNGAEYTSVIQSGWQDFDDPIRVKKLTHLTSFFNRTESGYEDDGSGNPQYTDPSGCLVQTRWEWTDQDVGRWTAPTQAYRYQRWYIPQDTSDPLDYGFSVIKTKLRMRGKGHAFSVRYESESGKDFQLLGFAVNVRAGTKV